LGDQIEGCGTISGFNYLESALREAPTHHCAVVLSVINDQKPKDCGIYLCHGLH